VAKLGNHVIRSLVRNAQAQGRSYAPGALISARCENACGKFPWWPAGCLGFLRGLHEIGELTARGNGRSIRRKAWRGGGTIMTTSPPGARIVVSKDGPYIVSGNALLADQTIVTDAQGNSQSWEEGNKYPVRKGYALCRCGHSNSKPFCDGTHTKVGFDGTETASRAAYLDLAKAFDGPALRLTDAEGPFASARFCDPNGKVWTQVANTDDPAVRAMFIRQVNDCPSGRLVAWDKATGAQSSIAYLFRSVSSKIRPSSAADRSG
jgi:CDGSH-type Zn-finger protein